ncbi:MAG: 1-acyl-sn-glycerol-3-phosphate acyltransferase [Myxococcota bacterium]
MSPLGHARSGVSLVFITANLAFWLLLAVPTRLVGGLLPGLAASAERWLRSFYLAAVRVDDFWLKRVIGLRWSMPDALALAPSSGSWIVLSNHVSWADVFLVQSLLLRHGLVIQFLTKRELLLLPVVGLVLWTFEFPLLRRSARRGESEAARRRGDFEALRAACRRARERSVALVCFAEGTRATPARRAARASRYRHLLPPRAGGFGALCDGLGEALAGVVDCTLVYRGSSGTDRAATSAGHAANAISFWSFLAGDVGPIEVRSRCWPAASIPLDRDERARWLEARWAEKDEVITHRAAAR